MQMKVYQMDIKCVVLNDYLNEEVYIDECPNFENRKFPNQILS